MREQTGHHVGGERNVESLAIDIRLETPRGQVDILEVPLGFGAEVPAESKADVDITFDAVAVEELPRGEKPPGRDRCRGVGVEEQAVRFEPVGSWFDHDARLDLEWVEEILLLVVPPQRAAELVLQLETEKVQEGVR